MNTENTQPAYDELKPLHMNSLRNTLSFFNKNLIDNVPFFEDSLKRRLSMKINDEYKRAHQNLNKTAQTTDGSQPKPTSQETLSKDITDLSFDLQRIYTSTQQPQAKPQAKAQQQKPQRPTHDTEIEEETIIESKGKEKPVLNPNYMAKSEIEKVIEEIPQPEPEKLSKIPAHFLKSKKPQNVASTETQLALPAGKTGGSIIPFEPQKTGALVYHRATKLVKPQWHRPWKLMRVISGHQGWVRCLAVDPSNQFFVTGSSDRTIKFWDLASGTLKITLTGHINTVRGLALSKRHAYLYSCAEDKTVKCWDLETNKIVRNYHGHLSGVFCLSLHPTIDVLATGGRDSVVRLWDARTRAQVHVFSGHTNVISSIITQEFEPQIVSGSHDSMIRLWDIGTGKCMNTLTNHKKAVRSLIFHHEEYTFASGAADNIKVWKCPEGEFLRNVTGHNAIINSLALNTDNVLVSCADNGTLNFWDWKSGYNFQRIQSIVQPGSISSENGVFCSTFDQSSLRLITGECDKTIKFYKEDEEATEETHPIDLNWRPDADKQRY